MNFLSSVLTFLPSLESKSVLQIGENDIYENTLSSLNLKKLTILGLNNLQSLSSEKER